MINSIKASKIGVIGGSIAGLAAGLTLRQRGYDVTILERSKGRLKDRGAGIGMPNELVEKCVEHNLFDSNISRVSMFERSFMMKDPSFKHQTKVVWSQPISMSLLNWSEIYSNLIKRFPAKRYLLDQTATSIHQNNTKCYVKTNHCNTFEFDRVIAADGAKSQVRNILFPGTTIQHANYVAWRGLVAEPTNNRDNEVIKDGCYMFYNGHLILYRIPAPDYAFTGQLLINWVMYETQKGSDNVLSIPPGMLNDNQIQHINDLAHTVLPEHIANLIEQTPQPFMQAIVDYQVPSCLNNRVCFLGDAASTKRPHTASGLVNAIEGAMSLALALEDNVETSESLFTWNRSQIEISTKQSLLAKTLGRALVTEQPDWSSMTHDSASMWWSDLMQGKSWYATKTTAQNKCYTPSKDYEIDKLAQSFGKKANISQTHVVTEKPKP